jgi:hypothetical protein
MTWQTFFLLFFFFIIVVHTTIDARAIQQDTVDQLVKDPTNEYEEMFSTLANYRHRFEHSNNITALRWMFRQHINADEILCKMCHILLPIVSEISSFSHFRI